MSCLCKSLEKDPRVTVVRSHISLLFDHYMELMNRGCVYRPGVCQGDSQKVLDQDSQYQAILAKETS